MVPIFVEKRPAANASIENMVDQSLRKTPAMREASMLFSRIT
jgi:hypothetical protein